MGREGQKAEGKGSNIQAVYVRCLLAILFLGRHLGWESKGTTLGVLRSGL
jgi:hypothetical protein